MNKEVAIGFFIVLIIASFVKIFFNYNININIIKWSIESIEVNIYILVSSLFIILGLIFIPKYMRKNKGKGNE